MAHPADFIVVPDATPVELIYNNVVYHNRILIRMSFKCRG